MTAVIADCFHHYSIFHCSFYRLHVSSLILTPNPRSHHHFHRLHLRHSDLFQLMCHTIWGFTSRKMIIAICFSYSNGFYLIKGTLVYGSSCLLRCSLLDAQWSLLFSFRFRHSNIPCSPIICLLYSSSLFLFLSSCSPSYSIYIRAAIIDEISAPKYSSIRTLAFTHRQKKIRLSENVNWDGAGAHDKKKTSPSEENVEWNCVKFSALHCYLI